MNGPSRRKRTARPVPALCGRFHRASELIGRRWTGAIIFVMLRARCRFAPLREAVPEIPVRVEYTLTKKGRALGKAVRAITDWAHAWIDA